MAESVYSLLPASGVMEAVAEAGGGAAGLMAMAGAAPPGDLCVNDPPACSDLGCKATGRACQFTLHPDLTLPHGEEGPAVLGCFCRPKKKEKPKKDDWREKLKKWWEQVKQFLKDLWKWIKGNLSKLMIGILGVVVTGIVITFGPQILAALAASAAQAQAVMAAVAAALARLAARLGPGAPVFQP